MLASMAEREESQTKFKSEELALRMKERKEIGGGIERNWNNRNNRLAQLGCSVTKNIL